VNDFSYTDPEIEALVNLWVALCRRHPAITIERIVGHQDIAMPPGRKTDPGPRF
jgi:AmpD protein